MHRNGRMTDPLYHLYNRLRAIASGVEYFVDSAGRATISVSGLGYIRGGIINSAGELELELEPLGLDKHSSLSLLRSLIRSALGS